MIEHTKFELLSQRVYGTAFGYEDLKDHDDLCGEALLAMLDGKIDPTGYERARDRDKGYPLAGKSTLNRLELAQAGVPHEHRYHKLLKIGALESLRVRRIWVRCASGNPYQRIYMKILENLRAH